MNILALDISGNHISQKEGSGTTGFAYAVTEGFCSLGEIKASAFDSLERYWDEIINFSTSLKEYSIDDIEWDHVVIEGYRLYNHKGSSASMQTNSTLQTSQLLGALRLALWQANIPYSIQYASEVKTRWSDAILIANGFLEEGNKFKGKSTNSHKRDALRHLVHFQKYKMKEEK